MPKVAFRSIAMGSAAVAVVQHGTRVEARLGSTPVNQPPLASPDAATVAAGETITIDVLANDVDPEGKALTLVSAAAVAGGATVTAGGLLSYTAPADFSGTDTVTYVVADSDGGTAQGKVTVTVEAEVAGMPPLTTPDTATVVSGGTVTIDVLANDTDPEGEALTVSSAVAETGSVSVIGGGAVSYTAPAGFVGTDTVTYVARDPAGNTAEGRVTVTVEASFSGSAGKVSIEVNRSSAIGPAGFYVVAKASGFGVGDELAHYTLLRYKWSFGEEGKVYDRLEDGENFIWDRVFDVDGVRTRWNRPGKPSGTSVKFLGIDKNIAYGPHTGIVYAPTAEEFAAEKARTGNTFIEKTITVEVLSKAMARAGAAPATASITVRVQDPEVEFGDANTAYISPSGKFPAGAANTFPTWNAAIGAMNGTERLRILFNRGETHDATRTNNISSPSVFDQMQFGAFGSGPDPVIQNPQLANRARKNASSSETIWGLHFKGPYQPNRPWDPDVNASGAQGPDVGAYANFSTVWDCRAEGFAVAYGGTKDMRNVCFGNCWMGNYWNYGFYSNIGVTNVNFSGCSFVQNWDTIIAHQTKDKFQKYYVVHGPFRISHAGKLGQYPGYVSHNACYTQSIGGHGGGHQPGIRMGGNGQVDEPLLMRTTQDRILSANGTTISNGVFKGTLYPHMQVWDKVVSWNLDSTGDGALVSLGCSGAMVRNTITAVANCKALGKGYGCAFRTVTPAGDEPQDLSLFDYPIRVHGNMIIDHRNDANFLSTSNQPSLAPLFLSHPCYSEWSHVDNLTHTPNRSASTPDHDTSSLPVRKVELGCGQDYPGLRYQDNAPLKTSTAALSMTVPPLQTEYASSERVTLYIPQPGSPAYKTGDPDLSPIDDLYGNIRPGTPSQGPVEPSSV